MDPKLNRTLIPLERIEQIVQLEPALILLGLAVISWLIYKIFLRKASPERHRNLRAHFLNLSAHFSVFGALLVSYIVLQRGADTGQIAERFASYAGLATMISGSIVFVKISRILMFEYLFLGHMREGVPVLIVNLFSLVLMVGIVGWFLTDIFNFRLTPVLATSAVLSLVLGLAVQDTLGNLFAGVALQLDKPYEIGDWIELNQGGTKYVGQVQEISWRATILIGWFDELLIIPNRQISQSEIANYSATGKPIWRRQTFQLPYGMDIPTVRSLIRDAAAKVPGVHSGTAPSVFIAESNENFLLVRCAYTITDFGAQFLIGSDVIASVVDALKANGHAIAAQRLHIVSEKANFYA